MTVKWPMALGCVHLSGIPKMINPIALNYVLKDKPWIGFLAQKQYHMLATLAMDCNALHSAYEYVEQGYDELIDNAPTPRELQTTQVLMAKRALELIALDWDNKYQKLRNALVNLIQNDDMVDSWINENVLAPCW